MVVRCMFYTKCPSLEGNQKKKNKKRGMGFDGD